MVLLQRRATLSLQMQYATGLLLEYSPIESFSEWFHFMAIFYSTSHNMQPNFKDFVWPVTTKCFQRTGLHQSSEDTAAQIGWKLWLTCVWWVSSLKSGTLRLSTKRCSNILPRGGHVISVFSAGNCNIYLEGAFVCLFYSSPPFPFLKLFKRVLLKGNQVEWEGFALFGMESWKVLRRVYHRVCGGCLRFSSRWKR